MRKRRSTTKPTSSNSLAEMLELKVPPLVALIIAATGMWAISGCAATFRLPLPGAVLFGVGIALTGIVVAVMGVVTFRQAGTTVDPRVPTRSARLVVSGVYRFSRNPMYLGFLLVLCGWGWYLGNVLSLALIPSFIVFINRFQITPEERVMRRRFAASYPHYAASVRRWL